MTNIKKTDVKDDLLAAAGWGDAAIFPLAGDASTRRYERLERAGKTAILMIAPPGAEAPCCPKNADEATRISLGYNAMARLAGPNLHAFVALADALNKAGLSAPSVLAADAANGFALLEDLGDDLFARVVGAIEEETLYRAAIDALVRLHKTPLSPVENDHYSMLDYDHLALETETQLLIDWYWPLKHGEAANIDICTEYKSMWSEVLTGLSVPNTFVLRDYHAENLLWLPKREGAAKVGVIDFQDALYGHAAYDIVSLLEDARRDVDPALAAQMIAYYQDQVPGDKAQFDRDYAILAAQRNAKILGIFARLAKRDNKPAYLNLLPRVEAHFGRDLERPALAPLRPFFEKHFPGLA
ncbi:aminoglycoside phosphotransferase family protein [Hyphococcus sp. DH-69]|uniref:aminoglycoside phosphotransferase family protein n=1 Tax=Hyphococcus formosus TaxID=3143534 RepID=UPI00398ADCFB